MKKIQATKLDQATLSGVTSYMSTQTSRGPLPLLPIPFISSLQCSVHKISAEKKTPKPFHPSIFAMTPKPLADQLLLPGLLRSVADLNLFLPFLSLGISLDFGWGEGKNVFL